MMPDQKPWDLYTMLVSLNALDWTTTTILLSRSGFMEANPLQSWIIETYGLWAAGAVKIPVLILLGWMVLNWAHFELNSANLGRRALALVMAGYSFLIGWHMFLIWGLPYMA